MRSLIFVLLLVIEGRISLCQDVSSEGSKPNLKLSPKAYSNLFVRRREEQKLMLNHLRAEEKYEKRYKLIELALTKIIEGLVEGRANLEAIEFNPKFEEFPQDPETADHLAFLLENTCLAGDIILHFPDMSYRILRGVKDWRPILSWCIDFVRQVDHVVDDLTLKMLDLFNQEINDDQRTADYVNPYREKEKPRPKPTKAKPRLKVKRGPRLSGLPLRQEL